MQAQKKGEKKKENNLLHTFQRPALRSQNGHYKTIKI
jgi:hypothetical protein